MADEKRPEVPAGTTSPTSDDDPPATVEVPAASGAGGGVNDDIAGDGSEEGGSDGDDDSNGKLDGLLENAHRFVFVAVLLTLLLGTAALMHANRLTLVAPKSAIATTEPKISAGKSKSGSQGQSKATKKNSPAPAPTSPTATAASTESDDASPGVGNNGDKPLSTLVRAGGLIALWLLTIVVLAYAFAMFTYNVAHNRMVFRLGGGGWNVDLGADATATLLQQTIAHGEDLANLQANMTKLQALVSDTSSAELRIQVESVARDVVAAQTDASRLNSELNATKVGLEEQGTRHTELRSIVQQSLALMSGLISVVERHNADDDDDDDSTSSGDVPRDWSEEE